MVLNAEPLPGGFTVFESADESRWWTVSYRGATPVIIAYRKEVVDPRSSLGRSILAATRQAVAA